MTEAMTTKTVYVIAGPTAVGKTAVAIRLAQQLNTAIISADSRQCYQGMKIGTAQPSSEELQAVPHYFIDAFPVTTAITAADFERFALGYLEEIFKEKNTAVVCGGTGLYIKALCEGMDEMPAVNTEIANAANAAYKEKGMIWLQDEVKKHDAAFYEKGENQNPARLLRALIFKLSTGESILNYRSGTIKKRPFEVKKFVLEMPREKLYKRINRRVTEMMETGLLEEVKTLYPFKGLKNLHTVGYQELFEFLDGNCSLSEAVEKIKQHTRNYAKRQMTWFRKESDAVYLDANSDTLIEQILRA
jgi:tRNA dimethylallyltransferase